MAGSATMTAQIHDVCLWRHHEYLLVGVDGYGLFNPADHDLDVRPTTTANWRGWVAAYAIQDDSLTLVELRDVGLFVEPGDTPPTLLGTDALPKGGTFSYPGLSWRSDFTGRLIIARGFIQSLYRHMGFHPAWKFEESWELAFDRGRITGARELTDEMRVLRERIRTGETADPDSDTRTGWIGRTFRLDFRRSKGD